MLEGLAAWVLNTYVGEYVENLNTDQLSIDLLKGAVELENLPLKKDALKRFDIPLEVKTGFIGKITLRIPLRCLHSQPWVINIDKLYVVIGPRNNIQYDEELGKKLRQDAKNSMLDALEKKWRNLDLSRASDTYSWFSYGASIAANILENIQEVLDQIYVKAFESDFNDKQLLSNPYALLSLRTLVHNLQNMKSKLNVKNVNVRYEDCVTNPKIPFAIGATIRNLTVQSADQTWVPQFVSTADIMYKLVDLQCLSVYCDSNISMSAVADELQKEMRHDNDDEFKEHEYMLRPVNAQARMKRFTSAAPLRSTQTPRISIDLFLDQVNLTLSTLQYRHLLLLMREFSRHERGRKYRRFRPAVPVSANCRIWWQFAIMSHLTEITERRRRMSWSFLCRRVHQVAAYRKLYTDHLTGVILTVGQQREKEQVEEDMEYEEIKIIRECLFSQLYQANKLVDDSLKENEQKPKSAVSNTLLSQTSADSETAGGNAGKSLFQRWFPGWSGWYCRESGPATNVGGATSNPEASPVSRIGHLELNTSPDDAAIEKEILDVLTDSAENCSFLRKDVVFAHMKFALKSGSFRLVENCFGETETLGCPLTELHCMNIKMEFESRPHSSAMKFGLAVESLFLEDLTSAITSFPFILCPQTKAPSNRCGFNPVLHSRQEKVQCWDIGADPRGAEAWQFFNLTFTKNPSTACFRYNLSIMTSSVDVIYMPALLRRIQEMFVLPSTTLYKSANAVSSWRLEKLQRETKAELMHTIDQLLESEHYEDRWDVDLDISAPRLIVPEKFTEDNPDVIIIDLGNFCLKTQSAKKVAQSVTAERSDFMTPFMSPVSEVVTLEDVEKSDESKCAPACQVDVSEVNVMDKITEKYQVQLSSMQVLVGALRDNWRSAYATGSSHMHVLDRFSISLLLERRLVITVDPHWPTAAVSGSLQSLTFHLNERKMKALRRFTDMMCGSPSSLPPSASSHNFIPPSTSTPPTTLRFVKEDQTRDDGFEDNKLFSLQFLISNFSVELQSRNRALVELQVTGVRANAQKKPTGFSLALTVHSLLVVDALQSYGPDFELLVASHHNVQLDSRSGRILSLEQDPSSFPQHPSQLPSSGPVGFSLPCPFTFSDAGTLKNGLGSLISLEFDMIRNPSSTTCCHGEDFEQMTKILNLHFNSLDFIANQETLVELFEFFKPTVPGLDDVAQFSVDSVVASHPSPSTECNRVVCIDETCSSLHITADFKRLNVLLVRFLEHSDAVRTAVKVATATLSAANVQALLNNSWSVKGSLGGLRLLDIAPENSRYQEVISIGRHQLNVQQSAHDGHSSIPVTADSSHTFIYSCASSGPFRSSVFAEDFMDCSAGRVVACRFSVYKHSNHHALRNIDGSSRRPDTSPCPVMADRGQTDPLEEAVEASFDMASLRYIHSPQFVVNLLDCVCEFENYMTSVAAAVKMSAMEVAMGMVGGRHVDEDNSARDSGLSFPRQRAQSLSDVSTVLLHDQDDHSGNEDYFPCSDKTDAFSSRVVFLKARMETPIIVIPCCQSLSRVLLAHLGEISMENRHGHRGLRSLSYHSTKGQPSQLDANYDNIQSDSISMSLKNMNLYSVDFDRYNDLYDTASTSFSGLDRELGIPILHNTAFDVHIGRRSLGDESDAATSSVHQSQCKTQFPCMAFSQPGNSVLPILCVLEATINISSSVKLELSKEVYEQILLTMNNLMYDEHMNKSKAGLNTKRTSPEWDTPFNMLSGERHGSHPYHIQNCNSEELHSTKMEEVDRMDSGSKVCGYICSTRTMKGTETDKQFLPRCVSFNVPLFEVELRGEFDDGERGLVNLKLYDFAADLRQNSQAITTVQLRLRSLQMDDLLEPEQSAHRQIMVSRSNRRKVGCPRQGKATHQCIMSTSCPNCAIDRTCIDRPHSLPTMLYSLQSSFTHPHLGGFPNQQLSSHEHHNSAIPCTPPLSPQFLDNVEQDGDDDLVHIDIILVDKTQPVFVTEYNRTSRIVDVKFSCLDTTINLQTWVILLEFLGMGSKVQSNSQQTGCRDEDECADTESSHLSVTVEKDVINTEVKFSAERFTLILNKPDYELARATADHLDAQVDFRDNDLMMSGQLGSLALLDKSPHGTRYTQRFVSIGKHVMQMKLMKFGRPDVQNSRDYDVSFTLKMSSILYVHTHRFMSELVAFVQHFEQLQDVRGRERAESAGHQVNKEATHRSRIKLDIEANSPIMLLPENSVSDNVLVADFGHFRLKNYFLVDGERGTLSFDTHSNSLSAGKDISPCDNNNAGKKSNASQTALCGATAKMLHAPASHDPMVASVYGMLDVDISHEAQLSATQLVSGHVLDNSSFRDSGSNVDPDIHHHFRSSDRQRKVFVDVCNASVETSADIGVEQYGGRDANIPHKKFALLDVMDIHLTDMNLFTGERVAKDDNINLEQGSHMEFSTYVVRKEQGSLLRQKIHFSLHVERNLCVDLHNHCTPDWHVAGQLSSVCCQLDVRQYCLVRGLLAHNLGENVEEFQHSVKWNMFHHETEKEQTDNLHKSICLVLQLHNVAVELLDRRGPNADTHESLASLNFIRCRLLFDVYSDRSKDVELVSHEIVISDTRFKDKPANARPNVFINILQPQARSCFESASNSSHHLQLQIHFHSGMDSTRFSVHLNNMRVMCIFDWLLSVHQFLMREPLDPFKTVDPGHTLDKSLANARKTVAQTPLPSSVPVSSGVVMRREPLVDELIVPFELKMDVSDTQFVIVENSSSLDTNAVILKSTAVLVFEPQSPSKVLSCVLSSLEVFSCCLNAEQETALSIIDPMGIRIELNANPLHQLVSQTDLGVLSVPEIELRHLFLQVTFSTLNVCVSYHDIVMFLAIVNSLPGQAHRAKQCSPSVPVPTNASTITSSSGSRWSSASRGFLASPDEVKILQEIGFTANDSKHALQECDNNLNMSALWLCENCNPSTNQSKQSGSEHRPGGLLAGRLTVSSAEVTASSISLCLIDDCTGLDIPLAEMSFSDVHVHQSWKPRVQGKSSFQLSCEYYNRNLSGWEPFLEPWRCSVEWMGSEDKMAVEISGMNIFNLNITSALLELYSQTNSSWKEDHFRQGSKNLKKRRSDTAVHCRSNFLPYIIQNCTGSQLTFLPLTTLPFCLAQEYDRYGGHRPALPDSSTGWKTVSNDQCRQFHFHVHEKQRRKRSHDMLVNQLVVIVSGYMKLSPVSIDKVGIYFRHARRNVVLPGSSGMSARIVLDVQQHDAARKLIVIRSALTMVNLLDCPVDLKMENADEKGSHVTICVPINQPTPIPLSCIYSRLLVRPSHWNLHFCNRPIKWQHVSTPGEHSDCVCSCDTMEGYCSYRFCVSVVRELYPEDVEECNDSVNVLPGHRVTLLPAVTLVNLLPVELFYYLSGTDVSGNLKPDSETCLHGVNTSRNIELGVSMENYPRCQELVIPPSPNRYKAKLCVYDSKHRILELIARVRTHRGGALRVSISVPFSLINKSGLPLVFRQVGTTDVAASQLEEHENARSLVPLLFSYYDRERPNLCQMRLGRLFQPDASPQWCNEFSLEGGITTRPLHLHPKEINCPDWVYNIGIQVTAGWGRYRDTKIVTLAPRFAILNQCKYKLAVSQKHFADKALDSFETPKFFVTFPSCKLPFHWTRVDLDQLLCVKNMEHPCCQWSGGFCIDRVDSFHINMRDRSGQCLLLKVEVILQGPTFFVIIADGDLMPPPFRLDNLSEVKYHQNDINDERMNSFLVPQSSTPYTWDEPTIFPKLLRLQIPGGYCSTYCLDDVAELEPLQYDNFIYLAAASTFDKSWTSVRELVLDCVHGSNIVFKRKEKGVRSQLWRMTSQGMLVHEGSVPLHGPSKRSYTIANCLVLDIHGIAPQHGAPIPLMLRKSDERRHATQTWNFSKQFAVFVATYEADQFNCMWSVAGSKGVITFHHFQDGMLCCCGGSMCVQSLNGAQGLQEGGLAVLGPVHQKEAGFCSSSHHWQISRQKLRPGSGCLTVSVSMDGPTRVLKIVDKCHRSSISRSRMGMSDMLDWEVYSKVTAGSHVDDTESAIKQRSLEVSFSLSHGVGVSLVNSLPEELIYMSFINVRVDIVSNPTGQLFMASVGNFKVDNQLHSATFPVLAYVLPREHIDDQAPGPAVSVSAYRVPHSKWNSEIFEYLYIQTKRLSIHVEERMLWKLMQFVGFRKEAIDMQCPLDFCNANSSLPSDWTSVVLKRYYFGVIKLKTGRINLSVVTSSSLPFDLKVIKHALSIPLVAFEEAKVDLDPYVRYHLFETRQFFCTDILQHYTQMLKGQAVKILGSVDFLGNPLGLLSDVTAGLSGLIRDFDLPGLIKNVTHGISNTTAKFASSVSDGVGSLSMDDSYNRKREELRAGQSGQSVDHLLAGVKGFGYGVFGGLTSLISQTISGTRKRGLEGMVKGMGKGLFGTVTKPVSGVLDLTSGVANALRHTSCSSSQKLPKRSRPPRCVYSPGGLLPLYSETHADVQAILHDFNRQNYTEYLIQYEKLRSNPDLLYAVTSNLQVLFLHDLKAREECVALRLHLRDITNCRAFDRGGRHYLSICFIPRQSDEAGDKMSRLVHCDSIQIASKVAKGIMCARNLFEEKMLTLQGLDDVSDVDDW